MNLGLNNFLSLKGNISEVTSDSFNCYICLTKENLGIVKDFYDQNLIEHLKNDQSIIIALDNLESYENKYITIEFVISAVKKIGFYLSLSDFILDNRLEIPEEFYINEISYSNLSEETNEDINKYKVITTLINKLTSKAKFISDEYFKTIYLVQDSTFIEIPFGTIVYENYLEHQHVQLIDQYIEDIESYKDKRTIFLKELIDFLVPQPKNERFVELLKNFDKFYEKCNTSFEYYLSNFSFNKIKVDLDNSVLEYSKNIRAIINESQSKLIAIPAAFILGVSQVDYDNPFVLKNILIVISTFLFSYIISIFINNQKSAIEIISDNLTNYKTNYQRSKSTQFEEERELRSLAELIRTSYQKIEEEILKQEFRLRILQRCNWGISIALLLSILTVAYSSYIIGALQFLVCLSNCKSM